MIALVTSYDSEKHKDLLFTLDNKEEYCKKHGYSFIVYPDMKDDYPHRWTSWIKVKVLMQAIEDHRNVDWFFWCDIDNLIMNLDIKLENKIIHAPQASFIMARYNNFMSHGSRNPLTSAFLMRNCIESYKILDMIYGDSRFKDESYQMYQMAEELAMALYITWYPDLAQYFYFINALNFTSVSEEQKNMARKVGFNVYNPGDFILSTYAYQDSNTQLNSLDKARLLNDN